MRRWVNRVAVLLLVIVGIVGLLIVGAPLMHDLGAADTAFQR